MCARIQLCICYVNVLCVSPPCVLRVLAERLNCFGGVKSEHLLDLYHQMCSFSFLPVAQSSCKVSKSMKAHLKDNVRDLWPSKAQKCYQFPPGGESSVREQWLCASSSCFVCLRKKNKADTYWTEVFLFTDLRPHHKLQRYYFFLCVCFSTRSLSPQRLMGVLFLKPQDGEEKKTNLWQQKQLGPH